MSPSLRRLIATVLAALAGLLLFAYAVRRAGVAEILEAVRGVGWGLLPILALGGVRFVIRAEAWRLCMPADGRVPWRDAFTAFLAADAMGNVTPLGLLASEPTKLFLLRHHLAPRDSVAALTIDNLVYTASVLAMIGTGVLVVLVTVPLSFAWREIGIAALVALAAMVPIGVLALRGWWRTDRGERPAWRERLAELRRAVLAFSSSHPARLWRVFALDLLFHAVAIVEAYLALGWLLGDRRPTVAQAIVFESLNRAVTVAFKFVPFRVGIDEATTGAVAPLLGVNLLGGVALAVVRKVRNLFWAGIGLAIIGVHHARAARATGRRENVHARRI
jgi:hypothetical protein